MLGQRVLMLTSTYPRWADDSTTPFVHDLAVDLRRLGWSVRVLAPHAPGAARDEVLDDVAVHRFRYTVPESAQDVCYGGGALENVRRSRSARAKLPLLVGAEWTSAVQALRKGVDVVHAHWTLPQGFVAATTPHRTAARVLTVHGGDVFGLRGAVLDKFAAVALRRADRVTVATRATEQAVREIAGDRVHVTRIPFGVDLTRIPRPDRVAEIRDRYRRREGPLLVFVGRIVVDKGVLDIVTAVRSLTVDCPDVTAVIVGAGQGLEHVKKRAADCGVGDRIFLPGWADPADVPSWFAAADVVLAPSRIGASGWAEGQGLSIIEAMAAARPVVATRTGGIPETITDGETGLLAPPSDPLALAAAITRIVCNPDLGMRLAKSAAEHVRREFDHAVTSARIADVYGQAIADRSRR